LVSVMFWGGLVVPIFWALNVRDETESVSGKVPVPERLTTCGLVTASSFTDSWPVRTPPIVGAKLAVRVHDALPASGFGDIGQVVDVCWKSPVNWKLLIRSGTAGLAFVMVIV
jgi:hypothetical protein